MGAEFSVVISAYNGEKYLARTIESVLGQTYPAKDILVVDDASTRDLTACLKPFEAKIKYIRFEKNRGVSAARNAGALAGSGNYIALLDQDDVWLPNKLKVHAEYISKFPEVGLFFSDTMVTRADTGWVPTRHFDTLRLLKNIPVGRPANEAYGWMLLENFICTASIVVIKKSIYQEAGGFDEDVRLAEDFEFWLRLLKRTAVVAIPEVLVDKRLHETNVSSDWGRVSLAHLRVLESILKNDSHFLSEHGWVANCKKALAHTYYELADAEFEGGRLKDAYSHYRNGYACNPTPQNMFEYLWRYSKKKLREKTGVRRDSNASGR